MNPVEQPSDEPTADQSGDANQARELRGGCGRKALIGHHRNEVSQDARSCRAEKEKDGADEQVGSGAHQGKNRNLGNGGVADDGTGRTPRCDQGGRQSDDNGHRRQGQISRAPS